MSCLVLVVPVCILCLDNADCDYCVMSAVWRMSITGRHHLRYKDVCVRDMKAVDIDTMLWEDLAADRTKWRSALKQHLKTGEDMNAAADKRARRKEGSSSIRPEAMLLQQSKKPISMYHPWS